MPGAGFPVRDLVGRVVPGPSPGSPPVVPPIPAQVVQLHTHLAPVEPRARHYRAALRRGQRAQPRGVGCRVRRVQDLQVCKVVYVDLMGEGAGNEAPSEKRVHGGGCGVGV
jgi:hypothetical protein